MKASKEPPCHTCRRQRLRCDASKPTCAKCAVRGVECLGYGAQPILWVEPQVQSQKQARDKPSQEGQTQKSSATKELAMRPGKKRGRPRLVLMSAKQEQALTAMQVQSRPPMPGRNRAAGRIWFPKTPELNPVGYQHGRLAIRSLLYYNEHICPDLVLVDSPANPHRLPVHYWAYFPEMMLDIIISASYTYQVIRSQAGQGILTYKPREKNGSQVTLKRHHLDDVSHPSIPLIYKHQQSMLKALNAELRSPHAKYSDTVLSLVVTLMRCEIQQSAYGPWPAHLAAARTIITQRGGFLALVEEQGMDFEYILSTFMLVDVMSTIMTPEALLDAETVKQLDYIPHLPLLYRDGLASGFPCADELVECLILINHTRYLSSISTDVSEVNALAEGLIRRIASFSPAEWAARQYENSIRPTPPFSSSPYAEEDSTTTGDGETSSASGDGGNESSLPVKVLPVTALSDLQPTWEDLAKAFQASTLLYCLQTLFLFRDTPPKIPGLVADVDANEEAGPVFTDAETVRELALKLLLGSIHRLWDVEPKEKHWCGKFAMWPMFVAGMELEFHPELAHERLFLCQSLCGLCYDLGDLSPLDAAAVLEATYARSERAAATGQREFGPWVDRMAWAGIRGVFFF